MDRQVGGVDLGHARQAAFQTDDDRGKCLAGLVMQLTRDASTLLLLSDDDPCGEPLGLFGLVADGGRVSL